MSNIICLLVFVTELSITQRAKLLISIFVKTVILLVFVYFFICALGFLTDAFQLLGGKQIKIESNILIANLIFFFAWCEQRLLRWEIEIIKCHSWLPLGEANAKIFKENEVLSNPVAGLMIGILATALIQSSSTTVSIVIALAGSKSKYIWLIKMLINALFCEKRGFVKFIKYFYYMK